MKKLTHSTVAKIAAIFLITVDMLVMVALSIGIFIMANRRFYISSFDDIKNEINTNVAQEYAYEAFREYINGNDPVEYFKNRNFYFVITDANNEELVSNYNGENTIDSFSAKVDFGNYNVYCFIDENFAHNDKVAVITKWVSFAYSWRYAAIALDVFAILFFLIILIFLYFSAGYSKGSEVPVLNPIGKIPFDVLTFLVFLIALIEFWYMSRIYSAWAIAISAVLLLICDFLLFLAYTMSFAVRVKLGNLISGTVIYKIIVWFIKIAKTSFNVIGHIIGNLPLVWKTAAVFFVIFIAEFFFFNVYRYHTNNLIRGWLLEKFLIAPPLFLIVISMRSIQKGGKMIAAGNLDHQIDTKYMFGDFKSFAEDLNNINLGMQKAVDTKMKSERFKTELITNVSHDIKTPLTSIINYVDLIKKENIDNDHVAEYVDVLDRQSVRLKKLIEDLVEASKASTGNLPLKLEPCNAGVLLDQAIAEYDDKLKNAQLELIVNKALFPVYILADGRHLWRIFDNLLNNICKYAQPLTRVYLDLQVIGESAVITFRNVSKYPLNISSDELMERFVRGDSSRNTEGNGLGLSIAKSLAELQSGTLELIIDGDLFKVSLKFKTMEER